MFEILNNKCNKNPKIVQFLLVVKKKPLNLILCVKI